MKDDEPPTANVDLLPSQKKQYPNHQIRKESHSRILRLSCLLVTKKNLVKLLMGLVSALFIIQLGNFKVVHKTSSSLKSANLDYNFSSFHELEFNSTGNIRNWLLKINANENETNMTNSTDVLPKKLKKAELEFHAHFIELKDAFLNMTAQFKPLILPMCQKVVSTLQGPIHLEDFLKKANLTSIVKFYNLTKTINFKPNTTVKPPKKTKKPPKTTTTAPINDTTNYTRVDNLHLINISAEFFKTGDQNSAETGLVQLGGFWKPSLCKSNYRLAIIVPFRDRIDHLRIFLQVLHVVLQRQLLQYRIVVVEPDALLNTPFNKGRIMNSAYLEMLKMDPSIDCFIFHDVDLLPEDDRNMYACTSMPRHLSVAIDKFDYTLPYSYLVGGVFAIHRDHYRLINGYSNMYWGWGGEDDDMHIRITQSKLRLERPPLKVARYKMLRHEGQKIYNDDRFKHLKVAKKRFMKDGVNTVKYNLTKVTYYTGFTHILLDVGVP